MIETIKHPWHTMHALIDATAMYILVVYMLGALAFISIAFGAFGLVAYGVVSQVVSLVVAVAVAYVSSVAFAKLRGITANHHSSIITGLILFFLITPGIVFLDYVVLAGTVFIAILSKYVLVYRKQHLVNAAALGVFVLALSGYGAATWWVATPWLVLPLIITGAIVVTKIRKWELMAAFFVTGFLVFLFEEYRFGSILTESWPLYFISYPSLFLGFFMLTEPFTMPPTKKTQMMYGVLVGFLSNTGFLKPIVTMTPELALLVGNLAVYPTTLRRKLFLKLLSIQGIAQQTYEYTFEKPVGFNYTAGQYLEWMLPHDNADSRGIRRYFTIASAPEEDTLRLALKVPIESSSFKKTLMALKPGSTIIASQLAGDFVLPKAHDKKIALVAGGIGITPFRSHLAQLAQTNAHRDIILFYCNNTATEVAYGEFFATLSKKILAKTVYVLAKEPASSEYETGFFSADIVKRNTPDYAERFWYISGPPPMVNATQKALRSLGVPQRQIKKDFFPGLA
ncbi:MAG: RnfABCDGE type electron transport complex subunit D [Patescibacteria group bacterium]